jgi:hypothetical protein
MGMLYISNGKLQSGSRRSRRPQAKKCGEGWLANAGGRRAAAEIAQIFASSRVILPLSSAYSSCYTHQTTWELNYCVRADCLLSEYVERSTIDVYTSHD